MKKNTLISKVRKKVCQVEQVGRVGLPFSTISNSKADDSYSSVINCSTCWGMKMLNRLKAYAAEHGCRSYVQDNLLIVEVTYTLDGELGADWVPVANYAELRAILGY